MDNTDVTVDVQTGSAPATEDVLPPADPKELQRFPPEPKAASKTLGAPAGYCVLQMGDGVPLCCRTTFGECQKSLSRGGCGGSQGVGLPSYSPPEDFCFAVHSDLSNGEHWQEVGASSDVELWVVWDYYDPASEAFLKKTSHVEADGGTHQGQETRLRKWTSWLPAWIYTWLNPVVDPDPQMMWCVQTGAKACEAKCLCASYAATMQLAAEDVKQEMKQGGKPKEDNSLEEGGEAAAGCKAEPEVNPKRGRCERLVASVVVDST